MFRGKNVPPYLTPVLTPDGPDFSDEENEKMKKLLWRDMRRKGYDFMVPKLEVVQEKQEEEKEEKK